MANRSLYDRPVSFTNLRHIAYDAASAARKAGRGEARAALLDDLLTAVCAEAETAPPEAQRPPLFFRLALLARRMGLNLNLLGDPLMAMRRREPLRLGASPRPAPEADSELLGLYREWRTLKSELDDKASNMDSALWKSGEKRLWEIEELIAAARPGTVQDMAVKIVVADDGDGWGDPAQKLLVEDALAILEAASA